MTIYSKGECYPWDSVIVITKCHTINIQVARMLARNVTALEA